MKNCTSILAINLILVSATVMANATPSNSRDEWNRLAIKYCRPIAEHGQGQPESMGTDAEGRKIFGHSAEVQERFRQKMEQCLREHVRNHPLPS